MPKKNLKLTKIYLLKLILIFLLSFIIGSYSQAVDIDLNGNRENGYSCDFESKFTIGKKDGADSIDSMSGFLQNINKDGIVKYKGEGSFKGNFYNALIKKAEFKNMKFRSRDRILTNMGSINSYTDFNNYNERLYNNGGYNFIKNKNSSKSTLIYYWRRMYDRGEVGGSMTNLGIGHNKPAFIWEPMLIHNLSQIIQTGYTIISNNSDEISDNGVNFIPSDMDSCYTRNIIYDAGYSVDLNANLTGFFKEYLCVHQEGGTNSLPVNYSVYQKKYMEFSDNPGYYFIWESAVDDCEYGINDIEYLKLNEIYTNQNDGDITYFQTEYNQRQLEILDDYKKYIDGDIRLNFSIGEISGSSIILENHYLIDGTKSNYTVSGDYKMLYGRKYKIRAKVFGTTLNSSSLINALKIRFRYNNSDGETQYTSRQNMSYDSNTETYFFDQDNNATEDITYYTEISYYNDAYKYSSEFSKEGGLKFTLRKNRPPSVFLQEPGNYQIYAVCGNRSSCGTNYNKNIENIYIKPGFTDVEGGNVIFKVYIKGVSTNNNRRELFIGSNGYYNIGLYELYKGMYRIKIQGKDNYNAQGANEEIFIFMGNGRRYNSYNQGFGNGITQCSRDGDSNDDPFCASPEYIGETTENYSYNGTNFLDFPKKKSPKCFSQRITMKNTETSMYCRYWDANSPEISNPGKQNQWFSGNIDLTYNISDQGGSNLDTNRSSIEVFYTIDRIFDNTTKKDSGNGRNLNSFSPTSINININGEGTWYVKITAIDNAENQNSIIYGPYMIDKTPPEFSIDDVYLDKISGNGRVYANHDAKIYIDIKEACGSYGVNSCSPIRKFKLAKEKYNDGSNISSESYELDMEKFKKTIIYGGQYIRVFEPRNFYNHLLTGVNRDISAVDYTGDDFDSTTNSREYSVGIYDPCDEAGNCGVFSREEKWNIYPNILTGVVYNFEQNISNNSSGTLFANGLDNYYWKISLVDKYGNKILPISSIGRKIDINIDYSTDNYLNQYTLVGTSGIKTCNLKTNECTFLPIGQNTSHKIRYNTNSDLNNGYYYGGLRSYVPNYSDSGFSKFLYGTFDIKKLNLSIIDKTGLNNTSCQGGCNLSYSSWEYPIDLITVNTSLNYKPPLSIKLDGIPPIALEGISKAFTASIIKIDDNVSSYISDINSMINFNKIGDNIDKINTYISLNSASFITSCKEFLSNLQGANASNFYRFQTYCELGNNSISNLIAGSKFYEKFELKPGKILSSNSEQGGFVSTHIAAKFTDGTIGVWNGDIAGRTNYNYNPTDIEMLNQNIVKVVGISSITNKDKFSEIASGDIKGFEGNISKVDLKNHVYKQVYNITRGSIVNSPSASVNSIDPFSPSGDNIYNYNGTNIRYYKNTYGTQKSIEMDGNIGFEGKYLLVIDGYDLFIKSNIQQGPNGLLGIVVLRNKDFGGNIYIKNDITNLESIIYADGALISYKGTASSYVSQENLTQEDLSDQLYIKGSLLTFNTMGGSRGANIYCPYFDSENCSQQKAQKYDIKYLRRFSMTKATFYDGSVDTGSWIPLEKGKLVGGVSCEIQNNNSDGNADKDVYCTDTNPTLNNYFNNLNTFNVFGGDGVNKINSMLDYIRPVIIEYDMKIRTYGLPIFSSSN